MSASTIEGHRVALVTSRRVYLDSSQSSPRSATIFVDAVSGRVVDISDSYDPSLPGVIDAGNAIVMPGTVDAHVHMNQPGRTHWEGVETATKAAAAGGCTTVVDMPLNSIPPTTTVSNFEAKLQSVENQLWVDTGFYGGIIPGNSSELKPLIEKGVCGFKGFLIESGVDEFPCVDKSDVEQAMAALDGTDALVMFHAELDEADNAHEHGAGAGKDDASSYSTFLKSRPPSMETAAIQLVIDVAQLYPSVRTHVVHLSAADGIPLIRKAKDQGIRITTETCYHYLCLEAERVPHGATQYKCCPPIRESNNRERLWQGLMDGTIDFVVSDHSPCTLDLKRLDSDKSFMEAWGGIASLQFGLSLMYTESKHRGLNISNLVKWMCEKPALHAGISGRKGKLAVGMDADIVIWDDARSFNVSEKDIYFKNTMNPYLGKELHGVVLQTILRGKTVYSAECKPSLSAAALGHPLL